MLGKSVQLPSMITSRQASQIGWDSLFLILLLAGIYRQLLLQ
jgi:hypothetical protein